MTSIAPEPTRGAHRRQRLAPPPGIATRLARNLAWHLQRRQQSARGLERRARAIGQTLNKNTLNRILGGRGNPRLDVLEQIARLLEVDVVDLLAPQDHALRDREAPSSHWPPAATGTPVAPAPGVDAVDELGARLGDAIFSRALADIRQRLAGLLAELADSRSVPAVGTPRRQQSGRARRRARSR